MRSEKKKRQITVVPIRFRVRIETGNTGRSMELSQTMVQELRRIAMGKCGLKHNSATRALIRRGLITGRPFEIRDVKTLEWRWRTDFRITDLGRRVANVFRVCHADKQ